MLTLRIDRAKLAHNAIEVRTRLHQHGIASVWPVIKVFAGDVRAASLFAKLGFPVIADSRLENLKRFASVPVQKALLRISSLHEAAEVVQTADISLQSEWETIKALEEAAALLHKTHDILLMIDLGDLREGVWARPFDDEIIRRIVQLKHVRLLGIGTNLTCFGGIVPDQENMNLLATIAKRIQQIHGVTLDIVSGGNSSLFAFLETHELPAMINSVRVGEAIVLGRETAYGTPLGGLHDDVFVLEGELIECKVKPSVPIGTSTMNSFGETVSFEDRGVIRRGILNIGKQDVFPEYLTPLDPNVVILGASSDHLIVELTSSEYRLGSKIRFSLTYPGLLQAFSSRYIKKRWK
jgi:predicted amino acid racemase